MTKRKTELLSPAGSFDCIQAAIIAGADAVDFLIQQNDADYTMTWEPRNAVVAQSGELGYTYGVYALRPSVKDTVIYGTYVSIWKKEKDGTWKFVLDSGNEGIGDKGPEQ